MAKPTPTTPTPEDTQRFRGFFRPGVLALFWLGFVVYGSLIPFDLRIMNAIEQAGGLGQAVIDWITSPRWVSATGESTLGITASASDLAVNLLLYLPFAMFLRMAMMRRFRSVLAQISGTCASVLAVSWLMESTQSLSPIRVASLYDVAANVGCACLGAVIAPWVWEASRCALFFIYCKTAPLRYPLRRVYVRVKHWPAVLYILVLFNAVVLTAWYLLEWKGSFGQSSGAGLPFEAQFRLPYDVAAVVLGRSLLLYAMLGSLISIVAMRRHTRTRLRWVVLGVVVVALGVECFLAITVGSRPDLTQPILAALAAVLMGLTVFTFTYAVRRSCRRRAMQTYEGEDRRGQAHRYGA